MRPPICALCHKRFMPDLEKEEKGGLISFVPTEEQKEFNKKLREPGFVGHPANLEWFCAEHYEEASKLKDKHKGEAISILRKMYNL